MGDESNKYPKRRYYTHRKGRPPFLSFEKIKELFLKEILTYLTFKKYLLEAEGFVGFQDSMIGTWGRDIPLFILKQLQMENIWPFREYLLKYDRTTFFTVIEFIFDYVSLPIERKGKIVSYEKEPAQKDYRERVNQILAFYRELYVDRENGEYEKFYEFSAGGEIHERVGPEYRKLIEEIPQTGNPENIDDKIDYATSRFLRYGATQEEKKDAIRTLGDVLNFCRNLV